MENHELVPSLAQVHAALLFHFESNYNETFAWISDTMPSILYGDWACQENIFVFSIQRDCEVLVSKNMDLVNDRAIYWRDPYGNTILRHAGPKVQAFLATTPLFDTLEAMQCDVYETSNMPTSDFSSMMAE